MKFSHLILRKIIKFVATRYQILKLKQTKFSFGWDSVPDRAGELTANGRGRGSGTGGEGKERGRRRREGKE